MKSMSLKKLRKEMEKVQTVKRYEHTLSVAYTAASLAMVHDTDIEKALTAGMLHDCAKCISSKKLLAVCEKNQIPITQTERENASSLLHAKVGSFYANKKYGITDEEILNAIKYHTTGRPAMSKLEKILYIADYIEPERKFASNLPEIRKMAYQDLDAALLKILEDTIAYLQANLSSLHTENKIDTMTLETYEYYKKGTK